MRVFKPQFRDRITGQSRETQKWYLDFRDHRQIRRRIPAERCRTEKQAERFGEMVEALVMNRQYGQSPDRRVADWLHGLPKGTLRKFAEFDLVEQEYVTATIPLSQHVADFEAWLRNTKARHGFGRSDLYIRNTVAQLQYIVSEGGFTFWGDVTKAAVETCLGKLDVASKTFNGYLASIKMFGDWMVENDRASASPVKGIKRLRWTKTEARRAMTQQEATALLRATALRPDDHGMSGVQRATMYSLALETGYRMGELRALTVGCFDIENAAVNLGAEHCKNREPASQYLKRTQAQRYQTFLVGRGPEEPVFAMPGDNEVLDMFRRDLTAAGIKPVDDRGVKVTFHSLRYGLATALDRSAASLKERMTIMRHSGKGSLTLGTYTTLEVIDIRGAVERLPEYPWPDDVKAAAKNPTDTYKLAG